MRQREGEREGRLSLCDESGGAAVSCGDFATAITVTSV